MAAVELSRWERLCAEIEDLRSHGITLSNQKFNADQRLQEAQRALARVEDSRRQAGHPAQPASDATRDSAQAEIAGANAAYDEMLAAAPTDRSLPGISRRVVAGDFDAVWFEQRAIVDQLAAEQKRLEQRRDQLNQRLNPLYELRTRIERWARGAGVHLPGSGSGPPVVHLPAEATGARPLVAGTPARSEAPVGTGAAPRQMLQSSPAQAGVLARLRDGVSGWMAR